MATHCGLELHPLASVELRSGQGLVEIEQIDLMAAVAELQRLWERRSRTVMNRTTVLYRPPSSA
jgi:hypothetical protein